MKNFLPRFFLNTCFLIFFTAILFKANSQSTALEYYELQVYHIEDEGQEKRMDNYLEKAFLPALQRTGIEKTGVFKPIEKDSLFGKAIYVLIPYSSLRQFMQTKEGIENDQEYLSDDLDYIDAAHDNPPYKRIETILLQAFEGMPKMEETGLTNSVSERIYELRSYESATEKIYRNKVQMFNEGEIDIFRDLDFNALFYAEVIAGCNMPNLMYMTSHPDETTRKKNWKAFRDNPEWHKLRDMEEYQDNVSHIDIVLLRATEYSAL